ncbi:TIGR03503 family protein [Aeromonas cavernicola]|uniref:TIGR03503 family protein n=1 Tax=Aeromonas cavernicola TaxID=1006623 RepID=A0A2H9U4R9_9GAMM|nr:TIGR03503 family protein [Aeromonas cavernicola]PJG59032.1 TIGR03503 family protein [Aeromonas cavernicola]
MSKYLAGLLLFFSISLTANEVFAPSDVPLLDNRFRIDYGVREVTFIAKRKAGSPSIILIRPDGSKLYVGKVKPDDVGWLSLAEYDLITLRNPMPGPWQAIGAIAPDNRVRLLSDVRLETDPLPLRLYQGEILKLKSWLLVDGELAKETYYLANLDLTVSLQALDNSQDGQPQRDAQDHTLGHYLDDGKELDERPEDGIMTAQAVLQDIPAGKYRAQFSTGNQVFVRAKHQDVLIYPLPLSYQVIPPSEDKTAKLSLLFDQDELDPASVAISGNMTDERGKTLPFSAIGSEPKLDIALPAVTDVGMYKVVTTLYATTLLGREIKLQLPNKTFTVQPPPPPVKAISPSVSGVAATQVAPEEEDQKEMTWLVWAAVGGGVILMLVAGIAFFVVQKRRALQKALASVPAEEPTAPPLPDKLDLNLPEQ